ncbi:fimbrial protein, partial [Bacteroides reticulotermitis]|uniref:fimbrial protein n=1 Tax=Bacteroides reticulotermitis TaxID=1133319 RepID=UPI003A84051A
MMKNFKYVAMMAAALTLGFSSCSNNDDLGNGDTIESGRPTKMTLAIAQPVTYAPDGNATTDETKIESVDVYIYSGSTFLKREHLTITDFDAGAGNVWTLKKAKEIATTTGAKTIYVGVNLPTTLA